jgi:DNA-binding MarR family transcriptional regulator
MTDLKSGANLLFLREEELRQAIELLFFAYRDFTEQPDLLLNQHGLGRAHHRALYFIGRHPGVTVSDLLAILGITKQSLARVLGQLVEEGFVLQSKGIRDRRQRLLQLTQKGVALERLLTENQRSRIAGAYRAAGPVAVEGFRKVMIGLIDERDHRRFTGPAERSGRRDGK